MDIELAIERYLVISHIKKNPEMLSHIGAHKVETIPGFISTTCVIDFGVVIIGSTVSILRIIYVI